MAEVQNSPKRAKQKILEFLKNRGGILRTGPNPAHQILHCRLFKQGNGSAHQAITAVQNYLAELAEAGEIIMRRDDRGAYNYVALPAADNPTSTTGGELTPTERDEFYAYLSTEYAVMQGLLASAQQDAAASLSLAQEYEATARTSRAERDAALTRAETAESKLAEYEANTEYDNVRKMLADYETELSGLRTEKNLAVIANEESLAEIKRLNRQLERQAAQSQADEKSITTLEKKVKELTKDLKEARKALTDEIAANKRAIAKYEKGDGLSAAKAVAVAMESLDGVLKAALDEIWQKAVDALMADCEKFLPADKRDAFAAEAAAARKKLQRRNSK